MSIASEIERIQKAKTDIATAITNKGVTVPENAKIDGYSVLVDQITGGEVADPTVLTLDVKNIADRQFADGVGLEGIKTLILPNVKTIGVAAFANSDLEVIDIGANVEDKTGINNTAFNTCPKLTKLIFRGYYTGSGAMQLSGTPINFGNGHIYVPDDYVNEYTNGTNPTFAEGARKQIRPLLLLDDTTLQAKTVTPTSEQQIISPDSNYYGLGRVTVNATPLKSKRVTPTEKTQIVLPGADIVGMSDVIVEAIPDIYKDVSLVSATPETVLWGTSFVNMDGISIGTMPNQGAVDLGVVPLISQITIPKGYHNGEGIVRAHTEELTVQADKEEIIVCEAGTKFWTMVTVEPATGGGTVEIDAMTCNATNISSEKFGGDLKAVLADGNTVDIKKIILPNATSFGAYVLGFNSNVETLDIGNESTSIYLNGYTFGEVPNLKTLIFRGWIETPAGVYNEFEGNAAILNGTGFIYVPDDLLYRYQEMSGWMAVASQIKPISELEGE